MIIILFFTTCNLANAEDYSFYVNKNHVLVEINDDGSADIKYEITFTTANNGKAIDIVDIGLPNKHYKLETAAADIDGVSLKTIRPSEYVSIGVEIPLTNNHIHKEEMKTLNFRITNDKMIYQDDSDERFASIEFYPNYFSSKYTQGTTDLSVSFIMPEGLTKDNIVVRHNPDVVFSENSDQRLVVTWNDKSASPSKQYKFGVSFPKDSVSTVYPASDYTPASSFYTYGKSNSGQNDILNGICQLAGVFIYLGIFILFVILGEVSRRGAKYKYLPPAVKVEGFGVNKELTPPEIAIINQLPIPRISSIYLARLIQLGIIEELDNKYRIKKLNTDLELLNMLSKNEREFFRIIEINSPDYKGTKAVEKRLKAFYVDIITELKGKLKKYDRKATINYYKILVNGFWQEISDSQKEMNLYKSRIITDHLDKTFLLLMTDKYFASKIKPILNNKDIPKPKWILNLKKSKTHMNKMLQQAVLQDDYIDDDYDFYIDLFDGYDYFIDISMDDFTTSITKTTNPAVFTTSSSYGGGGGCACACACACAGGGR